MGKRRTLCIALALALAAGCRTSKASEPIDDGEETFRNICAKCHGQAGTGGLPLTPGGPAPRDLTDPAWQATRTDAQLEQFVREGKAPMPSFKVLLKPEQIRAVIGKVRRLRKDSAK
ncbi:MAG TPA: cytochrome c [Kofleriaceae bacterium]|nr:cytochrome c [Kofleriaceae bacterium]